MLQGLWFGVWALGFGVVVIHFYVVGYMEFRYEGLGVRV